MEMKELERIIDERSEKQISSKVEEIKKDLGAVPQAQINEAVAQAVKEINLRHQQKPRRSKGNQRKGRKRQGRECKIFGSLQRSRWW